MFLFLGTAFFISEREVERLNQKTYAELNKLSKTDYFSKVKLNFYDKCPRKVEDCKNVSCEVPKIKYKNKEGIIDLLSTIESFSKDVKDSQKVWEEIYTTLPNEKMRRIISGLHFSVSTHISAFHTWFLGRIYSHPIIFKRRFRKEYKENFLELYFIVRIAVGNLKNTSSELISDLRRLSEQIDVSEVPKIDVEAISVVNKVIECIACLQCQKCILWGTIQARGLRSAIKSLNNLKLYKEDQICLINLFRRLSETVVQSRRLADVKHPYLYFLIVYHKQFFVISISTLSMALMVVNIYKHKYSKHLKEIKVKEA